MIGVLPRAINDWPMPKTVRDIQCFLGLASFYRRFIKHFSTIVAPLTNCLKKGRFGWDKLEEDSFRTLKKKLSSTPVLALPAVNKPFKVAVGASGMGMGAILSQDGYSIEYFSEKFYSRISFTRFQ